jgi:3-hydroxybutyryl-CoA dehydrogenase
MGNGIAHTFAQTGFKVNLVDVSEEALQKGISTISKNLDRIIAKGNLTEEQKQKLWKYYSLYTTF